MTVVGCPLNIRQIDGEFDMWFWIIALIVIAWWGSWLDDGGRGCLWAIFIAAFVLYIILLDFNNKFNTCMSNPSCGW